MNNEKIILDFFRGKGYTDEGIFGLMGNLFAESGLISTNLQNNFEKKLKMTDIEYTVAVDSGTYKDFIHDGAGYGIAQWTYWSRKEALLNYCKSKSKSIGNLLAQLEFLFIELTTSYFNIDKVLRTTHSVEEASNIVLLEFERPANKESKIKERISYGMIYYNKYKKEGVDMYSNSPLISFTKLSPNHSGLRNHKIDTITIHHMAGNLTIETCGNMFANPNRKGSSNYGIGTDGRIGLYVEEKNRSWCSSSPSNDHRAITIEVANDGGAPNWHVSDKAIDSLVNLLVDICKRNRIEKLLWKNDKNLIGQVDKQNMTAHQWFFATDCPGPYLLSKYGEIADRVNSILEDEEGENMTDERFAELMDRYLKNLASKPATFDQQGILWAQEQGLFQGDENGNLMPKRFMTRGDFAVVLQRFTQKFLGKK